MRRWRVKRGRRFNTSVNLASCIADARVAPAHGRTRRWDKAHASTSVRRVALVDAKKKTSQRKPLHAGSTRNRPTRSGMRQLSISPVRPHAYVITPRASLQRAPNSTCGHATGIRTHPSSGTRTLAAYLARLLRSYVAVRSVYSIIPFGCCYVLYKSTMPTMIIKAIVLYMGKFPLSSLLRDIFIFKRPHSANNRFPCIIYPFATFLKMKYNRAKEAQE